MIKVTLHIASTLATSDKFVITTYAYVGFTFHFMYTIFKDALMVMLDWRVLNTTMRGEWRYVFMVSGAQYVITPGIVMTQL